MKTAKRLVALAGTLVLTGFFGATQALAAAYPPKKPPEEVLPTVIFPAGPAEAGEGALAFTGVELSLLVGVLVVLVMTGALALVAARRRAARATV